MLNCLAASILGSDRVASVEEAFELTDIIKSDCAARPGHRAVALWHGS
jgi:hypothetical protein